MADAVILEAVRTPFARRSGSLREVRPDKLLALALRGLVDRAGIDAAKVEDVVNGTVTLAGEQGANPGRLGVLLAGFPVTTAGVSLNRMCGSSQQAVHFAAQAIAAGDMDYAIGSGVESMSRVPMFLDISLGKPVSGFETLNPELWQHHDLIHQGESAERVGDRWGITRAQADEFSKQSHRKAAVAREMRCHCEILPVAALGAAGESFVLDHDDGVRAVIDDAKIAALKPAFRADGRGSVTAANSSQISDGASAVLVANEQVARADGFRPRAKFRARVVVGSDPTMQLTGVIPATQKALQRAGLSVSNIDWFEVNEAFATVVLSWAKEVGADLDKVNPWGGAIAHGHPLGATGAGLMAKMLAGLEATGGQFGLQTMCIGHGMATATIIERVN